MFGRLHLSVPLFGFMRAMLGILGQPQAHAYGQTDVRYKM